MNIRRFYGLVVLAVCVGVFLPDANAQSLLTSIKGEGVAYTPVAKGGKLNMMGDYTATSGFTLGQSGSYLIAPEKIGMVTFNLAGKYNKLTFIMGPMAGQGVSKSPSVVTVRADGKKLLDEKFYDYDIPRPYEINVAGVRELTFDIIVGEIYLGVGDAKLWTAGQTAVKPAFDQSPATSKAVLVSELRPYYTASNVTLFSAKDKEKSMKINNRAYSSGLVLNMAMQISGGHSGSAMFNLRKKYEKLSFVIGPRDNGRSTEEGHGYVFIQGDGRTLYQKDLGERDMAEQVTIDVAGVERLSFLSDQAQWNIDAVFADITALPVGAVSSGASGTTLAAADPKLAALPDVCPLMSNIEPFTVLGGLSRENMLFTGVSDYITFSMGGVKYSEGLILSSGANVLHDNYFSSASFDLGNQFDYITFTAGHVSKAEPKNGKVNIYADDQLVMSIPVVATAMPVKYWAKINKCRKLTFDNRDGGSGVVGVSDIVLYRGEIVDNDIFSHPVPDCPDNIDLLRLGKPYMHYVSSETPRCYDGSDIREYWTLRDGSRLYNGFSLRTNVHFSLEHGVLGDNPDAAASVAAGAAALGASFVPIGMAGGAMIGSTLAGMAGIMMLAAGGEAEESSFAAFNTYGAYNSVTFSVVCVKPSDSNILEDGSFTDRQQRLLIGADGEVMAELLLNEKDGPTTFTVPINGCHQLMFWMPCDRGSGLYVVYDAKLSKQSSGLVRPETSVRSDAVVSQLEWKNMPAPGVWEKPAYSGASELDKYMSGVMQLLNGTVDAVRRNAAQPCYEIHTYYLKTSHGQTCKATQVVNNGGPNATRDATGVAAALGANFESYEEDITVLAKSMLYEVEKLAQLKSDLASLRLQQASAALDLPSLGLGAVKYGKELKATKALLNQCKDIIDTYLEYAQAQSAALEWLIGNAVDIDGKQSTRYTIFTPLASGETAPEGVDLQLVETFKVK